MGRELNDVNYARKNDTDLRNISDSLQVTTLNPELPGNRKHSGKMNWKEILSSNNMNKMEDEEVMTDDREKDRVYLEENEEDRERIEGKNPSISRLLR